MADQRKFRVALVQLNATDNVAENVKQCCELIQSVVAQGADFILTPEMTSLMAKNGRQLYATAVTQEHDTALKAFLARAVSCKTWLLIGSLPILEDGRVANRSFLINPEGQIKATYDKIHMFDVDLPDGEQYRESRTYQPGEVAVKATLPWAELGMTICYDLRFPALHRSLAQAGAEILSIPAAFTKITGEAHWHTLLRARAIENGCFVFAPAQTGRHANGRSTYGHSLIVSPWGEVLADGGEDVGVTLADIDMAEVEKARSKIPSLQHDRHFDVKITT